MEQANTFFKMAQSKSESGLTAKELIGSQKDKKCSKKRIKKSNSINDRFIYNNNIFIILL